MERYRLRGSNLREAVKGDSDPKILYAITLGGLMASTPRKSRAKKKAILAKIPLPSLNHTLLKRGSTTTVTTAAPKRMKRGVKTWITATTSTSSAS